jgi:hypothetical protein
VAPFLTLLAHIFSDLIALIQGHFLHASYDGWDLPVSRSGDHFALAGRIKH